MRDDGSVHVQTLACPAAVEQLMARSALVVPAGLDPQAIRILTLEHPQAGRPRVAATTCAVFGDRNDLVLLQETVLEFARCSRSSTTRAAAG